MKLFVSCVVGVLVGVGFFSLAMIGIYSTGISQDDLAATSGMIGVISGSAGFNVGLLVREGMGL